MKPIKAYHFSLNHLCVLDTETKKIQIVYVQRDLEINPKRRITKTTTNKYRKDYERNYSDTFVVTSPILANFSDDEKERELHKRRASSCFVGEYESIEELKNDFIRMHDATQTIRKKYHLKKGEM